MNLPFLKKTMIIFASLSLIFISVQIPTTLSAFERGGGGQRTHNVQHQNIHRNANYGHAAGHANNGEFARGYSHGAVNNSGSNENPIVIIPDNENSNQQQPITP